MKKQQLEQTETGSTPLTDRELDVIRLIEREFSNKQIAGQLGISERTVETHRKNILRKTKTNNVIGLIKYIYEHKLV
jgi:DNA-binding NarL/FixJ family response regulator